MQTLTTILGELAAVEKGIQQEQYQDLVKTFQKNERFFFAGEGRSGLMAKAIAMRLMHSGKTVFVVGETITPSIQKNDILVVLSGSATTGNIVQLIENAKKVGAEVFLVTTNKQKLESTNGLWINAATKHRKETEPQTIQPLGNQFDQFAHLILDAAIIDSLDSAQTNEELNKLHSNLE